MNKKSVTQTAKSSQDDFELEKELEEFIELFKVNSNEYEFYLLLPDVRGKIQTKIIQTKIILKSRHSRISHGL